MATKLFVITAPEVGFTGKASYSFMLESGANFDDFADLSGLWGVVERKGDRWNINLGNYNGIAFGGGVDEPGLENLLKKMTASGVLVMHRDDFDRFEKACKAVGIEIRSFHSPKKLFTN